MMYLVLDTETSMYGGFGKDSNPLYKDGILCIGYKYQDQKAFSNMYALVEDAFKDVTVLIGHNVKFDLLFLWKDPQLQEYLKRGGKIYDTQLVEYILSGQRHKYPALRDIAVNKYGCKERDKNIEISKSKDILTHEMDIELLQTDVINDVLDTESVALQQVKIAKDEGMWELIKYQMDALLATTEIEYNGMYIDREVFNKNQLEVEQMVKDAEEKCSILCEKYYK